MYVGEVISAKGDFHASARKDGKNRAKKEAWYDTSCPSDDLQGHTIRRIFSAWGAQDCPGSHKTRARGRLFLFVTSHLQQNEAYERFFPRCLDFTETMPTRRKRSCQTRSSFWMVPHNRRHAASLLKLRAIHRDENNTLSIATSSRSNGNYYISASPRHS